MLKFLRSFFFSMFMLYVDPPSLASGNPDPAAPNPDPAKPNPDPAAPNPDPAKPNPDPAAPVGPKPEELAAATDFLSKNVDGFTPEVAKSKKPEEIMALRGAYDTVQSNEARKYLKGNGAKAEDVAKMSNADAIKAADEARGKPVVYQEFQLPEGMVKDEALDTKFRTLAGKLKMSQADAQELVTAYSTRLSELVNAPYQQWRDTQTKWRDEVAKDPVVGGPKLQENLGQIGKMVDKVMGKDAKTVRDAMDFTGFGNNPAAIKFLFSLSKFFAEGKPLSGNPAPLGKDGNPATKLYPGQPTETAAS